VKENGRLGKGGKGGGEDGQADSPREEARTQANLSSKGRECRGCGRLGAVRKEKRSSNVAN